MAAPKEGQKILYRLLDSTGPWSRGTVSTHIDKPFGSIQKENGKFLRHSDATGKEEGEGDSAGSNERIDFTGANLFVARPGDHGSVSVYACIGLS